MLQTHVPAIFPVIAFILMRFRLSPGGGGGGTVTIMGYIGMCCYEGYGFQACF